MQYNNDITLVMSLLSCGIHVLVFVLSSLAQTMFI